MPRQHNKSKYFSSSALKRRGWTNRLIRDLLPAPRYIQNNGRHVLVWNRDDVERAENTPSFINSRRLRGLDEEWVPDVGEGTGPAGALFKEAWDAAKPGDSDDWLLARLYHEGLLALLPAASRGRPLRQTQFSSWIGDFLGLENRSGISDLTEVLKNFLRASAKLSDFPESPLSDEIRGRYVTVLLKLSAHVISDFERLQPEAKTHDLLTAEDFPVTSLITDGLGTVWSVWYVPKAIRTSLSLLIALNPKDEYPEARAMRRHFVIHLGGTNTGKTYSGFQKLIHADSGIYLAPLRLLALEAQETLLKAGVNCSLSTGEEEDLSDDDTHMAATAEKLPIDTAYDVAVIDECQMIVDPQRGYAWTRAILGVLAPEVHLCAAPEAKNILIRLIESCGDTYEIELHTRKTPLVCMTHPVSYQQVKPGDALITFSKIGVLSVAEDLRQNGKEPAIIYGALPYSTRRKQVESFLEGDLQYVVSTDAIGMGLNLPIRRIIFMETEKFDGKERRELKPEEIKQIAGRAGRYGMYSKGYVGATQDLHIIKAGLEAVVPPLQYAVVGFSELVLEVDFDLLEVLTEWNKIPTVEPYRKLDISRYISLITKMREMGFTLPKEQELRAANIPFDETDEPLRELFFLYLHKLQLEEPIEQPTLPEGEPTLPELELHYRKLDLYFSFSRAFDIEIDEDRLYESREAAAEEINEILLHRLRNNIRFCSRCGKALPLHQKGRLCNDCYRKERGTRRRRS